MMDWHNITMWILVVALFGLLVTVIVLMILQKTHDIKGEFVKDMLTMNTPIINFLTENNPKTKKADIEKIYDQNKEQIDCVYKNKETRNAFKQLVSSNCLIKEMVDKLYSLLLHFDTKSGKTGQPTPAFRELAVLLFTLVYAYQTKHISSSNANNMCNLFACGWPTNSGDKGKNPNNLPALFSDEYNVTKSTSEHPAGIPITPNLRNISIPISQTSKTRIQLYANGKANAPIKAFNTYLMTLQVNTRMFNENAGKFKKQLDNIFDPTSFCENNSKKYTVSEFNSVHNLLTTVNDHLIMMALPPFVKDLICHLLPPSCNMPGPVDPP